MRYWKHYCAILATSTAFLSVPAMSSSQAVSITIPAQSMSAALRQLAKQTKTNILFREVDVEGRSSKSIRGTLTPTESIHRLLPDFNVTRDGGGALLVRSPATTQAPPIGAYQSDGRPMRMALALAQDTAPPVSRAAPAGPPPAVASPPAGAGDDILVTARRVSETAQTVPISLSVLNAAALQQQSIRELRDIAHTVPNLFFAQGLSDASSVSIAIRGQTQVDILLTTDSSVGFYVDGVNVPRFAGLRAGLVDLERVEVLRGPQGTLYGRNTTGGAVSVITKDPERDLGGSLKLGYGNYDYKALTAVLNVPLSDTVSTRFVYDHVDHGGYVRDQIGRRLSDQNSDYVRGKIAIDSGGFRAVLSADYANMHSHGTGVVFTTGNPVAAASSRLTDQALADLGLPATPANYQTVADILNACRRGTSGKSIYQSCSKDADPYSRFKSFDLRSDMKYTLSDHVTLRSISGYRWFKRANRFDNDGTPFTFIDQASAANAKFWSQEFQTQLDFGSLSGVAGVYASREHGDEGGPGALSFPALTNAYVTSQGKITNKSLGVFGQGNWKFADGWTLTGGVRYSQEKKSDITTNHSTVLTGPNAGMVNCLVPLVLRADPAICSAKIKKTFSAPSWLVSLDYKPSRDILLYGKVARGFRSGGIQLRGTTVAALTPYDSEYSTEYEVGVKSQLFDRKLRFNLALYQDDYKGIQRQSTQCVFIPGSPTCNTTSLIANAASARIRGVEIDSQLRATDFLTFGSTFGYTHAKYLKFLDAALGDRSGEPFPIPKITWSLSSTLTHDTRLGELSLRGDYTWQDKVDYRGEAIFDDTVTSPSYGLLNARLSLALAAWNADIAVYMRNITDKREFTGASAQDRASGFNYLFVGIDPRTFGVEVSKHF